MRSVLNWLIAGVGINGVAWLLWALFCAAALLLFRELYRARLALPRVVLFMLVLGGIILYAGTLKIVEERLHIIQFGFLGWLAMRDLAGGAGEKHSLFVSCMIAAVFCFVIVGADELFQAFLPNRQGDIRDVVTGGIGAVAGSALFLLKLNRLPSLACTDLH